MAIKQVDNKIMEFKAQILAVVGFKFFRRRFLDSRLEEKFVPLQECVGLGKLKTYLYGISIWYT